MQKFRPVLGLNLPGAAICAAFALAAAPPAAADEAGGGSALPAGLEDGFKAAPTSLVEDGATIVFDFAGPGMVGVTPVRFEPMPGEGPMATSFRCGVAIGGKDGSPQALTTVGVEFTETVSCDGLVEIGPVTLSSGGAHLGLVYDFRSPNTEYRGALLASFDEAAGVWTMNEELSSEPAVPPETKTIAALREALASR